MRLYEQRDDDDVENLLKIKQATMQESTLPISLEELRDKKKGQGSRRHDHALS